MPSTHLQPPKQERSRKTLERIVRAALEILEDEGPDGLTVASLVRRADSSVGSFYARFQGKDDLLEYLGEQVWSSAAQRWDETLDDLDASSLPLPDLLDGAVRLLREAGESRATYLRALDQAGTSGDAFAAFRDHVLDGLAGLLLERRDELTHPDPDVAVRLGLRAVTATLDQVVREQWEPGDLDTVQAELGRMLRRYLTSESESGAEGGVEFFEVWS